MRTYVVQANEMSHHLHPAGGLVVEASDKREARKIINKWLVARRLPILSRQGCDIVRATPNKVYNFPNAGCCKRT